AALEEIRASELSRGQSPPPRAVAPARRAPWWIALVALVAVLAWRPARPPGERTDAAIDRLVQELKTDEYPRHRFDAERDAQREARLQARIARDQKRLAEIAAGFAPELYEPPRRAHVAFRIALCRWSLACWRHRASA